MNIDVKEQEFNKRITESLKVTNSGIANWNMKHASTSFDNETVSQIFLDVLDKQQNIQPIKTLYINYTDVSFTHVFLNSLYLGLKKYKISVQSKWDFETVLDISDSTTLSISKALGECINVRQDGSIHLTVFYGLAQVSSVNTVDAIIKCVQYLIQKGCNEIVVDFTKIYVTPECILPIKVQLSDLNVKIIGLSEPSTLQKNAVLKSSTVKSATPIFNESYSFKRFVVSSLLVQISSIETVNILIKNLVEFSHHNANNGVTEIDFTGVRVNAICAYYLIQQLKSLDGQVCGLNGADIKASIAPLGISKLFTSIDRCIDVNNIKKQATIRLSQGFSAIDSLIICEFLIGCFQFYTSEEHQIILDFKGVQVPTEQMLYLSKRLKLIKGDISVYWGFDFSVEATKSWVFTKIECDSAAKTASIYLTEQCANGLLSEISKPIKAVIIKLVFTGFTEILLVGEKNTFTLQKKERLIDNLLADLDCTASVQFSRDIAFEHFCKTLETKSIKRIEGNTIFITFQPNSLGKIDSLDKANALKQYVDSLKCDCIVDLSDSPNISTRIRESLRRFVHRHSHRIEFLYAKQLSLQGDSTMSKANSDINTSLGVSLSGKSLIIDMSDSPCGCECTKDIQTKVRSAIRDYLNEHTCSLIILDFWSTLFDDVSRKKWAVELDYLAQTHSSATFEVRFSGNRILRFSKYNMNELKKPFQPKVVSDILQGIALNSYVKEGVIYIELGVRQVGSIETLVALERYVDLYMNEIHSIRINMRGITIFRNIHKPYSELVSHWLCNGKRVIESFDKIPLVLTEDDSMAVLDSVYKINSVAEQLFAHFSESCSDNTILIDVDAYIRKISCLDTLKAIELCMERLVAENEFPTEKIILDFSNTYRRSNIYTEFPRLKERFKNKGILITHNASSDADSRRTLISDSQKYISCIDVDIEKQCVICHVDGDLKKVFKDENEIAHVFRALYMKASSCSVNSAIVCLYNVFLPPKLETLIKNLVKAAAKVEFFISIERKEWDKRDGSYLFDDVFKEGVSLKNCVDENGVVNLCDVYAFQNISPNNDRAHSMLREIVRNNKHLNSIILDFKNIILTNPCSNEIFKDMLQLPNCCLRVYGREDIVKDVHVAAIMFGFNAPKVINIPINTGNKLTAEERKMYAGRDELLKCVMQADAHVYKFVLHEIYPQIQSLLTAKSLTAAIRSILNKDVNNKVVLDFGDMIVRDICLCHLADTLRSEFFSRRIQVLIDRVDYKRTLEMKLKYKIGLSNKEKLAILKKANFKKGTIGTLCRYNKSRKVDIFGRYGKGETMEVIVARYEGCSESNGVIKVNFTCFKESTLYPKRHLSLSGELPSDIETYPNSIDLSILGMSFFTGSTYCFETNFAIDSRELEVYEVWVDDSNGQPIKRNMNLYERVKCCLDDWDIEYEKEGVKKAIVHTNKLLNRTSSVS